MLAYLKLDTTLQYGDGVVSTIQEFVNNATEVSSILGSLHGSITELQNKVTEAKTSYNKTVNTIPNCTNISDCKTLKVRPLLRDKGLISTLVQVVFYPH